jgi:hypothetical protein
MRSEARPARPIRVRWRLVIGFAVVLGSAVAFYLSSNHRAPVLSYRVEDQRTLVITAGAGAAAWTRVSEVVETGAEVRVVVESLDWPVSRTLELRLVEFTVVLSRDLGDRVVRDGSGSVVQRIVAADE